jgi:hypothetical protein
MVSTHSTHSTNSTPRTHGTHSTHGTNSVSQYPRYSQVHQQRDCHVAAPTRDVPRGVPRGCHPTALAPQCDRDRCTCHRAGTVARVGYVSTNSAAGHSTRAASPRQAVCVPGGARGRAVGCGAGQPRQSHYRSTRYVMRYRPLHTAVCVAVCTLTARGRRRCPLRVARCALSIACSVACCALIMLATRRRSSRYSTSPTRPSG